MVKYDIKLLQLALFYNPDSLTDAVWEKLGQNRPRKSVRNSLALYAWGDVSRPRSDMCRAINEVLNDWLADGKGGSSETQSSLELLRAVVNYLTDQPKGGTVDQPKIRQTIGFVNVKDRDPTEFLREVFKRADRFLT